MKFGKELRSFVDARSPPDGCVVPYKDLKGKAGNLAFLEYLDATVSRVVAEWSASVDRVVFLYTAFPWTSHGLKERATTLAEAGRVNTLAMRKICKKHDKKAGTNEAMRWLGEACARGASFASAKMLEVRAVAAVAPVAPECPVCWETVSAPVCRDCVHPVCSACSIPARACPVCRKTGRRVPLPALSKRVRAARARGRVPPNAAVLGGILRA